MEKSSENVELNPKASLDSLIGGEAITGDTYTGMFDDNSANIPMLQVDETKPAINNSANPVEFYEDIENKKRFIKHLNPEYKANLVYESMLKNPKDYPNIPRVGHDKRIFLRKLIREAKKGKLDRYFLTNNNPS